MFLAALLSVGAGEGLYQKHCSSCHGEDRLGRTAPPLLPEFLNKYTDSELQVLLNKGLPATAMPAYKDLKEDEIKRIVSFIKKPVEIRWHEEEIRNSLALNDKAATRPLKPGDIKNLTTVVERGKNRIWVMEGTQVLDSFEFRNMHGGIKYSGDGRSFFVPSRDGWIGRYDIAEGRFFGKARAGISLRNIAVSRDDKFIIAASLLPQAVVVLDGNSLKPVKVLPVEGKISAVYELHSADKMIFTFRDKPLVGVMDTAALDIKYKQVDEPLEDFFVDPFERYLIGSSRKGARLRVFDILSGDTVFSYPMESMPHLASAALWYSKGDFYFATPHIGKPYVSVWKLYQWEFVKKIDIGGRGSLARTHPDTPYLWVDNGSDKLILIDKKDFSVREFTPIKGKKATHTEFSGDGRIAYVSLNEGDGYLMLYDAAALKELARLKADLPAGKYNFVNKSRRFEQQQLGRSVFMEKCWGCHHPTEEAFGPSFKKIADSRDEALIRAQITDPEKTSKTLGYKRSAMPKIRLSPEETTVLVEFIRGFREVSK